MKHWIACDSPTSFVDPDAGLFALGGGDSFGISRMLWAYEDLVGAVARNGAAIARAPNATDVDGFLNVLGAPLAYGNRGVVLLVKGGYAFISCRGLSVGVLRGGELLTLRQERLGLELLPGDALVLSTVDLGALADVDLSQGPQKLADDIKAKGSGPGRGVIIVAPPSSKRARLAQARAKALGRLFLFKGLSFEDRMLVQNICQDEHFKAGDAVVQAGQPGDTMYVVIEGELEVSLKGRRLTTLGPGKHFGELALVGDDTRSADVYAITDTTLGALNRKELLQFCREHQELGMTLSWRLMDWLGQRVRDLSERVAGR